MTTKDIFLSYFLPGFVHGSIENSVTSSHCFWTGLLLCTASRKEAFQKKMLVDILFIVFDFTRMASKRMKKLPRGSSELRNTLEKSATSKLLVQVPYHACTERFSWVSMGTTKKDWLLTSNIQFECLFRVYEAKEVCFGHSRKYVLVCCCHSKSARIYIWYYWCIVQTGNSTAYPIFTQANESDKS